MPIQINGKLKTVIKINREATKEEVKEAIKDIPTIVQALKDFEIKDEIFVPQKIFNIVGKKK